MPDLFRTLVLTCISLVVGAILVVAGLLTLAPAFNTKDIEDDHKSKNFAVYESNDFRFVIGGLDKSSSIKQFDYSAESRVLLARRTHFNADDYQFLRLELSNDSTHVTPYFFWRNQSAPNKIHRLLIPIGTSDHFLITMAGREQWDDTVIEFGLDLYSTDSSASTIFRQLSLVPYSAIGFLKSIYYKWMSLSEWSGKSINSYEPTLDKPPVNLTPTLAVWCLISFVICTLLVLVSSKLDGSSLFEFSGKQRASLISIVLFASIIFSFFWAHQLLYRLKETRETYSGLSIEEKKQVDLDAEVYAFAQNVKQQLKEVDSDRIVWLLDGESARDRYLHYRLRFYLAFKRMVMRESAYSIPRAKPGDVVFAVGERPFDNFDLASGIFRHEKLCFKAAKLAQSEIVTMYKVISEGKECAM